MVNSQKKRKCSAKRRSRFGELKVINDFVIWDTSQNEITTEGIRLENAKVELTAFQLLPV